MKSAVLFVTLLLAATFCNTQDVDSVIIDWANVKPKNVNVPMIGDKPGSGISPHIVGGKTATRNQFPYQAALFMDSKSFCGGSLISTTVVLTAAHCTHGHRFISVYLGAHMIQENLESNRVMMTSTDHTSHPSYSPDNRRVDFDIAIVKLPLEVTLSAYIKVIRLPNPAFKRDYVGDRARVSGWGLIADKTTALSPVLKYVDVTVINNDVCRKTYALAINPDKLCVATTGGMSPCNGDSGGPLVIQESDRQYTQIGVVSFGSARGCSVGSPSVFTRVTSYQDNFISKFL